jgi:hypothetical protein
MARSRKTTDKLPTSGKRPIEQYDHKRKQRKNNPPVGLVTEATDRDAPQKRCAYDPHVNPTLTWAGKAEHHSFEVPTVSLHVHERIDPTTIIEAVRRRNGSPAPLQGSLFEAPDENPPLREAIDFYQHAKDIDELTREKTGMTFLKVQINPDLLTADLKKKRASIESLWLMGQPDVEIHTVAKGDIALWMLDPDYDGRSRGIESLKIVPVP